jgi:hypothetical protein
MSALKGDKARSNRLRLKKLLNRQRAREFGRSMVLRKQESAPLPSRSSE